MNPNEDNNQSGKNRKGRVALVVGVAFAIVAGVSLLPLEKMSNGKIKDYNLFSDVAASNDSDSGEDAAIAVAEEPSAAQQPSSSADPSTGEAAAPVAVTPKPNREGGMVVIEDYSASQQGMASLREAVMSGRLGRIAVVGDSYIEGDIMTQDLRAKLQTKYGGCGVGYMNMHSEFPGFRRSVIQGGKGWKSYTATKRGKQEYMGLSEQYSTSLGAATASYRGTSKVANASHWQRARFLFVAPTGATILSRNSADDPWCEQKFEASPNVQALIADSTMTDFEVKVNDPSVIALGVWLDGDKGISVDCMSSRGVPGYSLAKISPELCAQMRKFIDYDLIILEFGINAMSAKQKNYTAFTNNIIKSIDNVRKCYPRAQILLLGVGDRGEKRGGAYHSMSTIDNMIEAQREAAMKSGAMFWDTREAMGGEDAIVEWSKNGLANKDYIHLTHKGGEKLAESLSQAIFRQIHPN